MSGCASAQYHTFDVPVLGAPHSRQCSSCGEVQNYNPPTGQPVKFDDVLIDAEDLRTLIREYRSIVSDYDYFDPDTIGLCDRLELLLSDA